MREGRVVSYKKRIPNQAPLAPQIWGEPAQSPPELGDLWGSAESQALFNLFALQHETTLLPNEGRGTRLKGLVLGQNPRTEL